MGRQCYIIAEAGVNHNGSPELARELISVAAGAGADAVKFQTFKAEQLVTGEAKKAAYQDAALGGKGGQLEMLKRLELNAGMHQELSDFSKGKGIQFLSTAFDLESLSMLNDLGLPIFKIPSGEITNFQLLEAVAKLGKPVVLSTGMADLGEIEEAIEVMLASGSARADLTVLHCTTAYPTPVEEVNLKAMLTIGAAFPGVAIGYSDHTLGIAVPLAAAALGARVIEKHITLDKGMEGPDHRASLEPVELKEMVRGIREVELALGHGRKEPTRSESLNMTAARKSLVAARRIEKGEKFCERNVTMKRPGGGMSPMEWPRVMGVRANRDFEADEMITL